MQGECPSTDLQGPEEGGDEWKVWSGLVAWQGTVLAVIFYVARRRPKEQL